MELRSGVVRNVRRTATAYGNKDAVWTVHVLTFLIDTQAIELSIPNPPQIEDGDDVAVAGDLRDGTLFARAFRNRSNGTSGRWLPQFSGMEWFLLGLGGLLLTIGYGLLSSMGAGGLCLAFGCVFLAALIVYGSIQRFREDTRTSRAYDLVNSAEMGSTATGSTFEWRGTRLAWPLVVIVLLVALAYLSALVPRARPSNPFGVADVPDPTGNAVQAFAATVTLTGDAGDVNAEAWAKKVTTGDKGSLDGEWYSRWNEPGTQWSSVVTAEVKTVNDRVYILYKEANGYAYLFNCGKQGTNRLVGKYLNLQDHRDTYPWVGVIVDNERIDGAWMRGRWDFRRKLKE